MSDAITVIDKDLKVIFQNEAVHKIYGSKIGERCFEAYRGRQEPCENCIILDVVNDIYGHDLYEQGKRAYKGS